MSDVSSSAPDEGSVFYEHGREGEELCAGYLYKSPPALYFKSQKSWKRRYFLLLKNTKTTCQLRYFKSETMKSEQLGIINLSKVSLLLLSPETQPMWAWIHENFRCPASCVLYLRVADRDYFLIGENSWEIDQWFNSLYDALNNRPHRLLSRKQAGVIQDISAPPCSDNTEQRAKWRPDEHWNALESPSASKQESIYANSKIMKKKDQSGGRVK